MQKIHTVVEIAKERILGENYAVQLGSLGLDCRTCSCVVVVLLAALVPFSSNKLVGLSSVAVLFSWMLLLIIWRPAMLFRYFPLFFSSVTNVLGCVSCEYVTQSLVELEIQTTYVGCLPLLAVAYYAQFMALSIFDIVLLSAASSKSMSSQSPKSVLLFNCASTIACLLSVLALLHVLPSPSFILDLDRFAYQQMYLTGIWGFINKILNYFIVFPIISLRYGNKKVAAVAIISYTVYLLWSGNKFGAFFSLLIYLLLVFSITTREINRNKLVRWIGVSVAGLAALIFVSVFAYGLVSNKTPVEFLTGRLSQQGQLWWRVYDINGYEAHPDELYTELESAFNSKSNSESVGANNGIYRMMYLASTNSDLIDYRLSTGSRYTEGGFASSLYYLGPIGPVLLGIGSGALFAVFVQLFFASVRRFHITGIVATSRYMSITREMVSMFVFSGFFSTTTLVCLAMVAVESVLRRINTIQRSGQLPSEGKEG